MNSVGKAVLISAMLKEVKPDLACFVETWFDSSSILPQFDFFDVLSRRDRTVAKGSGVKKGGGVSVFVRQDLDLEFAISHIVDSSIIELSWHCLHTNIGPILLGVYYRPPDVGNTEGILQLEREYVQQRLECDYIGVIIVGDFNCHMNHGYCIAPVIQKKGKLCFLLLMNTGYWKKLNVPLVVSMVLI
jgi:hypothetical protein